MRSLGLAALALVFCGCGQGSGDDPIVDAGPVADASPDAGPGDSGIPRDATVADLGALDATTDAAFVDADPQDVAPGDAEPTDSESLDAIDAPDASDSGDAGPDDLGVPDDAGEAPDSGAPPTGCGPIFDCTDGIDADADLTVDEDAAMCVSPPLLGCGPAFVAIIGQPTTLEVPASDDGAIVCRAWSVVSAPSGAQVTITPENDERPAVVVDQPGDYFLRYMAVDDQAFASACDVELLAERPYGCDLTWPFPIGAYEIVYEQTDCNIGPGTSCPCVTSAGTMLLDIDNPSPGVYGAELPLGGLNPWEIANFPPGLDDGVTLQLSTPAFGCPRSYTQPAGFFDVSVTRDGHVTVDAFCYDSAIGTSCGSIRVTATGTLRCRPAASVCILGNAVTCDDVGVVAETLSCGVPCP